MSESVPGDAIETCSFLLPVSRAEGGLRGLDGPHELPAHGAVGSAGDQLVLIGRVEAPRPQIRESSASGGVERHTPGLTILAETHLVSRSTSAHRSRACSDHRRPVLTVSVTGRRSLCRGWLAESLAERRDARRTR
jgi:hypothetical protein